MDEYTQKKDFPASIIKVIDGFNIVINRGSNDKVSKGDHFLVYYTDSEELIDPETGESLGKLEVVRGTGVAIHVQPKITTIKSDRYTNKGRTIRKPAGGLSLSHALGIGSEVIEENAKDLIPFDEPSIGDKVKPTY